MYTLTTICSKKKLILYTYQMCLESGKILVILIFQILFKFYKCSLLLQNMFMYIKCIEKSRD